MMDSNIGYIQLFEVKKTLAIFSRTLNVKKNSFDVYEKVLYIVDSEPECLQIALSRAAARNKRPHLLTPAAY